ncbi:MAG TPA: RNA-binding protein [Pseudolabrys sp.]|nr:RNA-binding protein [Pseudolabrys sp.]
MLALAQDNELDRGAASVAPGTKRTCALTRELKSSAEMIRFVIGPAGDAVPDVRRKLPGRGIWLTATRTAVEDAVERNVFARGFKRDVRVAPDLPAQTERLIERAALDALAIAGKAGVVATGFSKVEAVIDRGNVLALIHAADASDNGKRKLAAALNRNTAVESHEIMVIDAFTGAQLDLALGCPNVVHAALLAGPGSETFLTRVARLMRFRTGRSPDAVTCMRQPKAHKDMK